MTDNMKLEYWRECISQTAEECDLSLTDGQLQCLTESVMAGHENYGMAFYSPPSSDRGLITELKRQLTAEREKVFCAECKGTGREVIHGPIFSSTSSCGRCHGEGKVSK